MSSASAGLDVEVAGGAKDVRSVFDNLSYKGKAKLLGGSLLMFLLLFLLAIVRGTAAQKEFSDTYVSVSSMPSDFDGQPSRCRLIQGQTFGFMDLFKSAWHLPHEVTTLASGTPASSSISSASSNNDDMSGLQVFTMSFNREYTDFSKADEVLDGSKTPNSALGQHFSSYLTFYGTSFGHLTKAYLELTAITFKQVTNPAWPNTTSQYFYEVHAGTSGIAGLALGQLWPQEYGSDATKATNFELENFVALGLNTDGTTKIMITDNNAFDTITLTSDGSKIWELAGGIECKPSSSEKFASGFLITMAWLVFVVSFIKAYWLTSKWTLLMKNKGYFRAKGASLAEQIIHEIV